VRSDVGDGGVELKLQKQGKSTVSLRGFSGRKEMTSGGLELRLTSVKRRRQGSSAMGENGGRKKDFGRRGQRLIYTATKTGLCGTTAGRFGH
jgi:hypothetical protein